MSSRRWITQTEMARRLGVHTQTLIKAIQVGRVGPPAIQVVDGKRRIVDPNEVERQFHSRTDASKSHPKSQQDPGEENVGLDLAEWNKRKAAAEAKLKELKLFREMGKLILARDIESAITDAFERCKVRVLGIHVRARQQIPHLTREDVTLLEDLEREACEELAIELGETDDSE